ncbi:MAG: LD-carboxypeptidase [Candidatus Heimdallarchaeota archaeon]|nr:LD-carboxypeptidase [Candidatus Heimdallarchaeota archaeon]MCG3254914.1 LD-carboxypeptidase [Candidatus Heimdallarchaeota archaeon]MCK4609989.1 LD-carboxypeptidase [Candidatus Heimdallarchaeota archaeon]
MKFIKPKKLQKGDTVGIISSSWGGPNTFPHIYEAGLLLLKEMDLQIKEFPTTKANAKYLYINPEIRANDVNEAFLDEEVSAIFASIGGDDSVRTLPYLDADAIKSNPKIVMGYSDTSILLTYANQQGLVTFNGPSIMAGFSQMREFPSAIKHVEDMLFNTNDNYVYKPYKEYVDGYPDWAEEGNTGKVHEKKFEYLQWSWLQGTSKVDGELFGGCIEVLEFMKGTDYWPVKEFWDGKILFFETSEEKPSPDNVKYMLRNYGVQGIFEEVKGILFGRARDYSIEEKKKLDEIILNVVKKEFGYSDLPIVTNMDFGHTDPQFIMPLGCTLEIDCEKKRVSLLESPVRE